MADNVAITAGSGTNIAADDIGSVFYQRVKLSHGADGSATDTASTTPLPVRDGLPSEPADATFTRPADTTAYAIGDLIANNTTAGSVTRLSWTGATLTGSGGSGLIEEVLVSKSNSAAARIRVHFLKTDHAVTNGDNGALVLTSLDLDNYIGYMDVSFTGTDDDIGTSASLVAKSYDPPLAYVLGSGDTVYAVLQALTAFTPGNAEVFAARPKFLKRT